MKSNVRALVRSNGIIEFYYDDDTMSRGRGFMKMDLETIKRTMISWSVVKRAFVGFAEGDKREIKRLFDLLVYKP